MSKGQTKKTREAAGNRRKLTRAEKKQIAAVIRQTKGDGKAHTAQQTIPYLAMYPDGICKVAQRRYSKSIAFEDINYQLAQADDKTAIFENWCDFLNYFDASVNVQLSFINQGSQQEQAARAIHIPPQNDAFNSIRTEYSDMLKTQLAKGNNGLVKHKYITFSIEADNPAAARARLSRIETDVLNNFKVLGVSAHPLSGYERLKVLHGVFHPAGEPFSFSYDWLTPAGLTTKDFMLIVQDQIWNRVTINRAEKKSTRYYMDEFHLLLKEEQTAAYSVEIWKRFRKWGGIPTAITQNIKDLLASREVENIFENSDFVLIPERQTKRQSKKSRKLLLCVLPLPACNLPRKNLPPRNWNAILKNQTKPLTDWTRQRQLSQSKRNWLRSAPLTKPQARQRPAYALKNRKNRYPAAKRETRCPVLHRKRGFSSTTRYILLKRTIPAWRERINRRNLPSAARNTGRGS